MTEAEYQKLSDHKLGDMAAKRVMGWRKRLRAEATRPYRAWFAWEEAGLPHWEPPVMAVTEWRPARRPEHSALLVADLNALGFDVIQHSPAGCSPMARVGRNPNRAPLVAASSPGRALMIAALLAMDAEEGGKQ